MRREVISSGSTTLNCHVTGGNPVPVTISWFRNGQPLLPSNRITFSRSNRKLYIVNAEESDAGEYTCVAKNRAGQAEKKMSLEVLSPPRIHASQSKQTWRDVDSEAVLRCETDGYPEATITWYKLGHYLDDFFENGEIEKRGDELIFREIKPEYSGTYSCIARNKAGSDQFEFDIMVHQKPDVSVNGLSLISQGKILSLKCDINSGNPRPTIQWKKDGMVILSDSKTYISPDRTQLQESSQLYVLLRGHSY